MNKAPSAMIMAAGKGTRMMPLTANKPKPLVTVGGTTLLDHVLDHLRGAGVRHLVVNVHYLADQVVDHLLNKATDFYVQVSCERDLLRDTGGGLVQAKALLDSDPFLCVNADNMWTDGGVNAFTRLVEAWDDQIMDVLMLVVPFDRAGNTQGIGDFDLAPDGRLSRDGPKRQRGFVWTGIQMMSKRIVTDPPEDVFSTNVFWDRAIKAGRCFGLWFDVGYPEAIEATEAALAHG
jgi:MurNAc alpha-1-phosphate uridylyltransferase